MNEMGHERWSDELAAYLLGALEPGEAAELERHLAGCEECRTELEWLRPAILALPESVERVEPPPALRARVLAEARSDVEPVAAAGSRRSPQRLFRPRPLAGLVVLALLVAAVAGYTIGDSSGGGTSTIEAGHAPGVTAKVVREGDSGTLTLANVRQLPGNKILQAWVRRGDRVVSARSLFAPNRNGKATATIPNMRGVNTVMVTAEPRGGSSQPTSVPIVSVAIPQ